MRLDSDFETGQGQGDNLEAMLQPQFVTALKGIRRGIERETLRVSDGARLSDKAHPSALGSPLTHKFITTDYAESMLELISPVETSATASLDALTDIHRQVYQHLDEELIWPFSMPCDVSSEDEIKLAYYGTSNLGRLKNLYRQGLRNRYGSLMQAISGVHYNFSMPDNFWPVWKIIKGDKQPLKDFISESYFGLIRNFMRIGWLVPYLFGASPFVGSSFLKYARKTLPMETLGRNLFYLPKATSLRMSDLGYNSRDQDRLAISYNSLDEFVNGLRRGTSQTNSVFRQIDARCSGKYCQLNPYTLQSEAEFYAPIRPKRVANTGESLCTALSERGVEYIEIRSLDVNPFADVGIDLEQVHFLDVLLTYCLLTDSPLMTDDQQNDTRQNLAKVANNGRDPALQLIDNGQRRLLSEWSYEIFSKLSRTAEMLDFACVGNDFIIAVDNQLKKLVDPELTLSGQIMNNVRCLDLDIGKIGLGLARKHRQNLTQNSYATIGAHEFSEESVVSMRKQRLWESSDDLTFDEYLRSHSTSSPSSVSE